PAPSSAPCRGAIALREDDAAGGGGAARGRGGRSGSGPGGGARAGAARARGRDRRRVHAVGDYGAGQLEQRYAELDVEEDVFINYGYVPRSVHALMHPRTAGGRPPTPRTARARSVLGFVRERGEAHPREVDLHFSHGVVTNYWGGSSRATTHLLESMHYRGLVRVVRRDRGVRIYA